MAEVSSTTNTPTYDYSSIGSVGGEAAQSVNGEMINKIRAAEEKAKIDPLTEDIDNIALEREKIDEIKSKITEFQGVVEFFDIYNEDNVFNQHIFDSSGNSAVFDAVDKSKMKEGTTTISVSQLALNDVYQSTTFGDPSALITGGQDDTDKLTITVGTGDPIEISTKDKTYQDLVNEINLEDGVNASIEQVGDGKYRLIIKGAETGEANTVSISQTGLSLGFGEVTSNAVPDWDTTTLGAGSITIDGVVVVGPENMGDADWDNDNTLGKTYSQIVSIINNHADFNATADLDTNTIKITRADGSAVNNIVIDDLNLTFSDSSHIQSAQNLHAKVDGVDYDVSSNSITTQDGALKITAIKVDEPGESTNLTISKDTSAVKLAVETMIIKYNELTDMINDEIYSDESVIEDKSALRGILTDIKGMMFAQYGADSPIQWGTNTDEYGDIVKAHSNVLNNDKSIFLLGITLDKDGHMSVEDSVLDEIINRRTPEYDTAAGDDGILGTADDVKTKKLDFDDIKNIFTGAYENKGLGVQLDEYLDALDGYDGILTKYESRMDTRKEDLEEDKKDALKSLDTKYGIMAEQFSAYSAIIAQMEAQFSGLKMMIQQSVASN